MKKIIAVTCVALMMFALATSAFALLPESSAAYKNPPVFIDGLVVSDAWMSGLTAQNWKAALTNQAYAEGAYIYFIAKIGVSSNGDTDAQHLWDGRGQTATLTFTGKDNCLNFSSANMATLSRISGMSVDARSIRNNDLAIVEATENKAVFTFTNRQPDFMDTNRVLGFNSRLEILELDSIYPADVWSAALNVNSPTLNWAAPVANVSVGNRATLQKDFYLHFMAITKASTEGVCIGTLKVNGEDTFTRDVQLYANASYSSFIWYNSSTSNFSNTQLLPGDRSNLYLLYNSVNGKTYSVMKIKNFNMTAGVALTSGATATQTLNGPYGGVGHIYVLMNKEATEVVCGFVVDGGSFKGLVAWNKDDRLAAFNLRAANTKNSEGITTQGDATGNWAIYYEPIMSNDLSNASVDVIYANGGGVAMSKSELQAIFDFHGFAYQNPRAPGDADFLARSGLVTVAEAKYNVANAVINTPDQTIVIPKTGDAATSTGLILVASAILAAAAVGFVLSKRAHN